MIYMNIGKLLEEKGKTRYWLVKQLDSNYTTINNMINNVTQSIRYETIDKLCDILDCTPNDLFIRDKK